ncbi:ribonuclease Z [Aeropyrum pernix K1]|uniref:Ribonuclease Z n=1 Tax=Aeropyrum pernix (strain ATCC 700893 / DSM 11879 / JCM 9820 / NBRC 100138 / K1) TaxID=272557 RepID=RNZ_AERPE|nr:ribonuclease Z [Aeropyrum pernix]Q9YAV8.2 RecName: Full=Ribonuclease Z; Short=RNase Z; AltName: Full=tRNA 3 endonuclease; AltName: Full=tRNase Z [Aeropyrum pernix K1]BAA80840.2 ribonuclease Z [Aeropyrum pernix K1]
MGRIDITILGSGSAVPSLHRWHPSILVKDWMGNTVLLDAGEGVQIRLRKVGVSPSSIDVLAITHPHGDHINGVAGLLMTMSLQSRRKPLTIISTSESLEFISETLEATRENLGFEVMLVDARESGVLDVGRPSGDRLTIEWERACHNIESLAFKLVWTLRPRIDARILERLDLKAGPWIRELIEKGRAHVEGRIVTLKDISASGERKYSVAYTGDTSPCTRVAKFLHGSDILIHDSTLDSSLAREAAERGHSTSLDAARNALTSGAKLLILFHVSSRYSGYEARLLLKEARRVFPNTVLSWDGMKLSITI